jgi:hypothetical protein
VRTPVTSWAAWVVLLAWLLAGCSTSMTTTRTASPPEQVMPTQSPPQVRSVLVEKRQIVLEWPEILREKDSDFIVLSLVMDPQSQVTVTAENPDHSTITTPVEISNAYETHNVMAVARLDIAGLDAWREEIREPMRPGKTVTFRWSIRAQESGVYRGLVWLYLDFVPKDGGEVEQVILLSRPFQVEAVSILGMPGWAARSLGGAGMLVSTVLGYPFVQPLIGRLRRQRAPRARHKK